MKKIILASQSPRRKELLEKIQLPFITQPADIDETLDDNIPVSEAVKQLSLRKAEAILDMHPDAIVIGSDTIVTLNHKVLGKPANADEAFAMLKMLQGNTHQVITGLAIISTNKTYTDVTISNVTFAKMTDEEIYAYINTGECSDKAGAYGIQGYGGRYITNINGDYYSIMGLPLNLVYEESKHFNLY